MDFLIEIFNDAIANGMNKTTAKSILLLIKDIIKKGEYPILHYNDWQNIVYSIIDDGYMPTVKSKGQMQITTKYDREYLERKINNYIKDNCDENKSNIEQKIR